MVGDLDSQHVRAILTDNLWTTHGQNRLVVVDPGEPAVAKEEFPVGCPAQEFAREVLICEAVTCA